MKFRKSDYLLISALLLVALFAFAVVHILQGGDAGYVEIMVDGKIEKTFSLEENQSYVVDNQYGRNVITIENGKVYVEDADCPDKLCVKQGTISKNGQSLICLPHKLIVKIVSDTEDEVDAVAN